MSRKTNIFQRIGQFIAFLTDKIYSGISASPVGRFFKAYPASDRLWRNSATVGLAHPHTDHKHTHPVRRGMAQTMDNSVIRRSAYALLGSLCRCSLRTFGAFFLTTGIYSALISWVVDVIWRGEAMSGILLFASISLVVSPL